MPSPDQREVRRLLDIALRTPEAVIDLPTRDLDLLLRVARRAGVIGRLAARLDTSGDLSKLPAAAADQLRGRLAMADSRIRLANWELDRIAWAMGGDTETPLVLMKGCTYVALELPNVSGRVFADVDLLTSEDRLEDVEATLNRAGWLSQPLKPYDQNYYRKWTHELPPLTHPEREVEIDLHHNVLPRTARLKPDGSRLLERSRALPGSRYRVLCDEDIVLHAMTHLMFDSDLADKLRDLVDVADLLEHFSASNDDFWNAFVARASELDLERPAYYSLRYCMRFLGTAVPAYVQEAADGWRPIAPVRALMDALAERALFPLHPDRPSRWARLSRLLLYMRSHWIRMPPWLLGYHLSVKFVRTRVLKEAHPD